MASCTHTDSIKWDVKSHTHGKRECEDCVKIGARWVHLRKCMTCGHVACCDSSPNKHATKHSYAKEHPIVMSYEPGEQWLWCYVDEAMMEYE
ncbi:Zn-finger-containing protein [Hyaloraphidium curvatum]|nr:Zn-finger-containing protein [Hyaloraphidium curvatum]